MSLNEEEKVLAAPKASGSLTLRIDDDTKEYSYELRPLKNIAIGVGVDLSEIIDHTVQMDVTLDGIAAQPVSFHAMGTLTDDTLADAVLISLQRTCPVLCRLSTRDVAISPVGIAFLSALAFAKRSEITCWHRSSGRWDAKLEAC